MEQYTQIPNIIIDKWMAQMHSSSFTVLMVICRKTLGWQKEYDYISISQIIELTGLSNKTITSALKELLDKNLIINESNKQQIGKFSLNLSDVEITPDKPTDVEITPTNVEITPELVKKLHTQKKDKETNTKEKDELYKYLKDELTSKYKSFTNTDIQLLKKDFVIMHNIIKFYNPTKQIIYDKIEILYQKTKESKNGFWMITPSKLYSSWNELVNIKQQEKQIIDPYKHASKA